MKLCVPALSLALTSGGCVHPNVPAANPSEASLSPVEPQTTCAVTYAREKGHPPFYVRPVIEQYRFDEQGRLRYAIDQPGYFAVRKSRLDYDQRGRVAHVYRMTDEVVSPSMVDPNECDGPSGWRPCRAGRSVYNDRDTEDETFHYDAHDRRTESIVTEIRYDHQGGTWIDAPSVPGWARDYVVLSVPKLRVGGTIRPFLTYTRHSTFRYDNAGRLIFEGYTGTETVEKNVSWAPIHSAEELAPFIIRYEYETEGRFVTRYRLSDDVRARDQRVERNDAGQVVNETSFSNDQISKEQISKEVFYQYDGDGRRIETRAIHHASVRSEITTTYAYDAMGRLVEERELQHSGTESKTVTTYAYDPLGRLATIAMARDSEAAKIYLSYDYGPGCGSQHRVPEDPRSVLSNGSP